MQVVERFTDIDLPIIKILFEEDFPVLDAVRTFILSRPWGREYELIYSNEHLLELTAAGATKADWPKRFPERFLRNRRIAKRHLRRG